MSDGTSGSSSLAQNGLPPYWDGHYSNTWSSGGKYAGDPPSGTFGFRPMMNADEWEENEPKAYRTDKTSMSDGSLSGLMQL